MARLFLVPVMVACILSAILALAALRFFSREPDVRADRDHSLAADLASQRRMAECYRSGCSGISVSPILGCAWRLVILEETHAPDDADAATSDCDALGEKQKQTAATTKENLWNRLHLKRWSP